MKKLTHLNLCLLIPIALYGQTGSVSTTEIDLSDVVVVEDVSSDSNMEMANPGDAMVDSAVEVVEIPDNPIEGASIDIDEPVVTEVTEALPMDSAIVLELPGQDSSAPGEATLSSEETISIDFPDEDIRTILRNVADLFELNLVIPDTLQGRTSIKLREITWRQAFEVVLEPLGFTYVEDRNIIRIKSIDELTTEPVDTSVFIVNYANAADLQASIRPLIDPAAGGGIQVDSRSNALVITERPSRMNKIQIIIESLDKPTDQVMIESKFIEITNTDTKNIGINWASMSGYSASAGPFQRDWSRERGSTLETTNGDSTTETFSIPGGLTLTETTSMEQDLVSLASTTRLDTALFSADQFEVILSALNATDDIKLVSNPTVVTLNNTQAKIAIGERYPIPEYSFNSETGQRQLSDVAYEDIGINLDVTPQVNNAGFINLKIIPEVSSSDRFALIENTEIPIIESRRTETSIMIKDGHTLAIGGLVEDAITNRDTKVPVLGDIPGLGRLFSSDADTVSQRNLVIFITAKTLNPDGSSYRDVIDPRVIDRMGIVPSELPGYEISDEEQGLLDKLEAYRSESALRKSLEDTQQQLDAIEYKKAKEEEESKDKGPK